MKKTHLDQLVIHDFGEQPVQNYTFIKFTDSYFAGHIKYFVPLYADQPVMDTELTTLVVEG